MATQQQLTQLRSKATTIRRRIVEMIGCKDGKTGHLGGSCSCADMMAALYFYKMHIDPARPDLPDRDRFLMSKGHAVLAQYAALGELGFFSTEEFSRVKTLGSMLQGHPDKTKTPGIEANTGSLGQGLSIASGLALGLRLDGLSSRVYVMMGDGEMAEGQIWEAAMAATNFGQGNLIGILDRNRIQATGSVSERFNSGDLAAKWRAFGWAVIELDGHDMAQVCDALDQADTITDKPVLLLAETIKGKGVSFAQGTAAFHNAALTGEQYAQALRELQQAQ